jgi:predicted adenylyl cyclase CyaB
VASLEKTFEDLFERTVRVNKLRTFFVVYPTRVHLDVVEGLGCFVELETTLSHTQSEEYGHAKLRELAKILDIDVSRTVSESYSDMMLRKMAENGEH